MTDKWGEIQGKSDLVRVSGDFELSEFELSAFYYQCKVYTFMSSVIHTAFSRLLWASHRRERQRLDKSILWTLLKQL